jgi:hypothetical protein
VAVPALIQHVASSANPVGVGITGNAFKCPIPNPVGSGNCLILGITYPHGKTVTVTDNNGNTWPSSPVTSVDAGVSANIMAVFVLPNAAAGQTTLTITFNTTVIPFQYTLSEYNNIATVTPVNGFQSVNDTAGPNVTLASFTPTNNNANGGNMLWFYAAVSGGSSDNPTGWVPNGSFALLDADIAWNTGQGFPHASCHFLQATSAAIAPSMAATGSTLNGYHGICVALKAATAGTAAPGGIYINKIIHQTSNQPAHPTWNLLLPAVGNLRVLVMNENTSINATGITDNESGTWTKVEATTDEPQYWYSPNKSPNSSLAITITSSGTPSTVTTVFYDISGADPSPYDTTGGMVSTSVSGLTSISNAPTISPTTANGLVLASMGLGQGPGLSVTSPAGAVWDLCTYTSETDTDLMENADAKAHYYNAAAGSIGFAWTFTSQASNTAEATAIAFKAVQPASGQTPYNPWPQLGPTLAQ